MTDVEILYLYRLVEDHIDFLERQIEKKKRHWSRYEQEDELLYFRKVVVYEDEKAKMESIRDQLRDKVAKLELQKKFSIEELSI